MHVTDRVENGGTEELKRPNLKIEGYKEVQGKHCSRDVARLRCIPIPVCYISHIRGMPYTVR